MPEKDTLCAEAAPKTNIETIIRRPITRFTAILTVYNRLELTKKCLETLFEQTRKMRVQLSVVIVDDGSTDGTAEFLARTYPGDVRVINSDGHLYWSAGMALAESTARKTLPDALIWINNDVTFMPNALRTILKTAEELHWNSIVSGAMQNQSASSTTYSAFAKVSRNPGKLRLITPEDCRKRVDTVNGNFVLVPRSVYQRLGGIDKFFAHAYGDIDYGLRAGRLGIECWLAPGYLGVCDRNSNLRTWHDPTTPKYERLIDLFGRKGLPMKSHVRFVRRHGGHLWPLYVARTYGKAIVLILLGRSA